MAAPRPTASSLGDRNAVGVLGLQDARRSGGPRHRPRSHGRAGGRRCGHRFGRPGSPWPCRPSARQTGPAAPPIFGARSGVSKAPNWTSRVPAVRVAGSISVGGRGRRRDSRLADLGAALAEGCRTGLGAQGIGGDTGRINFGVGVDHGNFGAGIGVDQGRGASSKGATSALSRLALAAGAGLARDRHADRGSRPPSWPATAAAPATAVSPGCNSVGRGARVSLVGHRGRGAGGGDGIDRQALIGGLIAAGVGGGDPHRAQASRA